MEITQYNSVRADLAALEEQNRALVFVYHEPAGNKNARSHVYKLRQKKADIERVRVAAKAEILEAGRSVDAVAKELTGKVDGMILVHQKPLDEIEAKERAAKAEIDRLAAEAKAKEEQEEREMREAILAAERREAAKVKAELEEMKAKQREDEIRREAAEQARQAAEAKAASEKAEAERKEREAVESAQRAEREKQQAILNAERAKIEADRQAVEAERRRIEATETAKREAAEAAERAEREKVEAAARAEREKVEAVKRAVEESQRKEREATEARERDRLAAVAAEAERAKNRKVREQIIAEMVESIGRVTDAIDLGTAQLLAGAMLDGKVKRVTVSTEAVVARPQRREKAFA